MQCEWCTAWHAFAFFQSLGHSPTAAVRQGDGPATRRRSTWMCRAPSLASSRRPPVNAQLESTCVRIKLWRHAPTLAPFVLQSQSSAGARAPVHDAARMPAAGQHGGKRTQKCTTLHGGVRAPAPPLRRRPAGEKEASRAQEASRRPRYAGHQRRGPTQHLPVAAAVPLPVDLKDFFFVCKKTSSCELVAWPGSLRRSRSGIPRT